MPFTPQQREEANDHQVLTFFAAYDHSWRLAKILSIKFLLEHRDEVKAELINAQFSAEQVSDSHIFGAYTNGLIFSALSEALMYIEDILALIKFIRSKDFFARNITQYAAGRVTALAGSLRQLSEANLLKAFMVPGQAFISECLTQQGLDEAQRAEFLLIYNQRTAVLRDHLVAVLDFFDKYEFFYNQYKHGLTVALEPFGAELPPETIAARRADTTGLPICFDNVGINIAHRADRLGAVIIPRLGPAIQPHLTALQAENNLLRYHSVNEVDIQEIINIGKVVYCLSICIRNNRVDLIQPSQAGANTFCLPTMGGPVHNHLAQFTAARQGGPLKIDDFSVAL